MNAVNNRHGLSRRSFVKGVAGVGGALFVSGCAGVAGARSGSSVARPENIGVQLYTVRDRMAEDFEGTIEQVAEMGYKELEFAGYYDRTPAQVRQLLDRLDLRAPSTHVGLEPLREDLEGQLNSAETIGHTYLTVPALPGAMGGQFTADDWHRYAEEFNRLGAAVRERGMRFAYHNHSFEFVPAGDGRTGYDILLAETDPEFVDFELDLMWTVVAGRDPVALFEQYPGRFAMWHVKDMRNVADVQAAAAQGREGFRTIMQNIAAVGEGGIDFPRIFARSEQSGLRHFFVENDAPQDSLANIRTSYGNLSAMLS